MLFNAKNYVYLDTKNPHLKFELIWEKFIFFGILKYHTFWLESQVVENLGAQKI